MAMTAKVKDELSRLEVTKPCCRKAEVASTLRFAGGLHIVGGRIVVEAELDTANAARRTPPDIADLYGHSTEVLVMAAGGLRKSSRYVVRVVQDGEALARQTGLIDARGRPVRGLPPKVVRRRRVRRGGGVAGGLPRPWLADRAGPVVGPRGHLPGAGGSPGPGGRSAAARHRRQGARGARGRPGGAPRRRRHRGDAHPAGGARRGAGLGGAADAPRGPGHRQPAGQLRRREPAPLGACRGGRGRPGAARPRDPRRGRPRPPARGRHAAPRAQAGLARGARPARPATDDQGRRRRAGSAGSWRWPTSGDLASRPRPTPHPPPPPPLGCARPLSFRSAPTVRLAATYREFVWP